MENIVYPEVVAKRKLDKVIAVVEKKKIKGQSQSNGNDQQLSTEQVGGKVLYYLSLLCVCVSISLSVCS